MEFNILCKMFVCRGYLDMDRETSVGYLLENKCGSCGRGGKDGYEKCNRDRKFTVKIEDEKLELI